MYAEKQRGVSLISITIIVVIITSAFFFILIIMAIDTIIISTISTIIMVSGHWPDLSNSWSQTQARLFGIGYEFIHEMGALRERLLLRLTRYKYTATTGNFYKTSPTMTTTATTNSRGPKMQNLGRGRVRSTPAEQATPGVRQRDRRGSQQDQADLQKTQE